MIAAPPQPAASYLRRSTSRQEKSIVDQRNEIARWASASGYVVVREYVDDAVSGTSSQGRLEFQKMIADASKGAFKAVIVWNSDRFSRGDVTETEFYRHTLRQAGVTVLSVTEDYLAREGIEGDVLRTVKQFQNRQFSISLSQNTLRGQISSVLAASDPGRMAPFGFDRQILGPDGAVLYRLRFLEGGDRAVCNKDGTVQARYRKGQMLRKPGKECRARLVLSDPARVSVIRDIFQMCVGGFGCKRIADELNRRGILSPKGRLWQFTTVKAIIQNPVYRGDVVWNRRTESKFFEVRQGRADQMKPTIKSGRIERVAQDDWIVIENAVPAIVDRVTWDRAQAAAARRAECASGKGKQIGRWLLSGVMRCACCGSPFWGVRKRKGRKVGRKEIVTAYYICAGRTRCGKSVCPYPSHVKADDLEAWVLGKLQQFVMADGEGTEEATERFVRTVREQRTNGEDCGPLKRELAQIEATVDALVTGLDPANLPLVNDKLSKLRHRREFLQGQLRASESAEVDEKALRRWATERLTLLGEIAAGRRDERARQALASYVDEIVIDPATKTGVLVANGGLDGADGPNGDGPDQKHRDPPSGGSQVAPIAGARVGTNLRPRVVTHVRFEWGLDGDGCSLREDGGSEVERAGRRRRPEPVVKYPVAAARPGDSSCGG